VATAFQSNAFQNNAFQIEEGEQPPVAAVVTGAGAPGRARRRRRYIFPDGTSVFATPGEADALLREYLAAKPQLQPSQKVKQKGAAAIRMPRVEVPAPSWKRAKVDGSGTESFIARVPRGFVFRPTEEFEAAVRYLRRRVDDEEALLALMI
jgi:hypothetical protein